jgi:multidrug efflux pump subunit AcrA (membrane-fusion protein)
VDFDTIVARVFVPEHELPRLEVAQEARILAASAGTDARFGRIDRISPVVDPKSGTVKVTVAIPRSQGLAPGMYVEVELVVARRDDALLVPKQALIYDDVQAFVYRFTATGTATAPARAGDGDAEGAGASPAYEVGTVERLRVVPALEDRQSVVPSGDTLGAGDRVVLAGQAGLEDGAEVRVVEGVADRGPETSL